MKTDVYIRLAKHLDKLPGGFPSTESGVEIRILKRLFTPEEAELDLKLTLIPEEVWVIAHRAKIPEEEAAARLEEMAKKGLIYRMRQRGKPVKYLTYQFIIGIWEFHVNDLDSQLIADMNEYIPILFNSDSWSNLPQLRTIPVGKSIDAGLEILPYEHVEELIRSHKRFAVAPCICRKEKKIIGKSCGKPMESCLVLGGGVDYYVENGIGREITLEETLEVLKNAEKAGLVLQPSNSRKIVNICCCCGCCCQVLINLKKHPQPAQLVFSPFQVKIDLDLCSGCGVCLDRCQMDAFQMEDSRVSLEIERCIGCGLCVTTCPTGALRLQRKPETLQKKIPKTWIEALYTLAKKRGKLGPIKVLKIKARTSFDRFKAARSRGRQ